MKKLLVSFLVLALSLPCLAQNRKTTITGAIKSLADGTKIELYSAGTFKRNEAPMATTTVTDGKFVFTLQLDEPRYLHIEAGPANGNYSLLIAPSDDLLLEGATFRNVKFSGSELQNKYYEIVVMARPRYMTGFRDLSEEKQQELIRGWIPIAQKDAAANASNILGLVILYYNSGYFKVDEAMYEMLSPDVRNSFHGRAMREYLDTFIVGKQAPTFTARDVNGKEYTLSALLAGNKYLLVDFWASWCAPCRKSIPEMKEFALKYAADGMAVVSISTDKDRDAWIKAMDEEQMPWTNVLDADGTIKAAYGVTGIPSVFLIDASGKVIFEKLYGEVIAEELRKVFGK